MEDQANQQHISSHQHTVALGRSLTRVLTLLNLRNQQLKGLAHIRIIRRTRLRPPTIQALTQFPPLLRADLSLLGSQIALVPHDTDGHAVGPKVVEDLVAHDLHHLERGHGGDAVDEHVAMDADKVLAVQDGVLVLAGRVDDLGEVVLVLVADGLGEGVFDRGVVAIYKVPVDELHGQGGFAFSSISTLSCQR